MSKQITELHKDDNKKIHAPFRYAGGKFYALKYILPMIPTHQYYVEPFCGGSRVYFAKKKSRFNWLNDVDSNLINCYVNIRDHPLDMAHVLAKEVATKARHRYYKLEYKPKTALNKAIRWYYLNRTSFSGIMKTENCYFGYGEKYSMPPSRWKDRIVSCSRKIHGVKLTSHDFEKVIDTCPDNAFLFVDPPYYSSDQHKFYTFSFTQKDHMRLMSVLKRNKKRIKFLLTYDDIENIRSMYDWADHQYSMEWLYAISRTDDQKTQKKRHGKRSTGREIFITNYDTIATHV